MGFFQDLKQDLSQTVNDLEADDTVAGLNLDGVEGQVPDLFGVAQDNDFADFEAVVEKNAAALDDELIKPSDLQEKIIEADVNMPVMMDTINNTAEIELNDISALDGLEQEMTEMSDISDTELEIKNEQSLNEEKTSLQEPVEGVSAVMPVDNFVSAASTDTAIITSKMSIIGDVTSSGNMDLIGTVTGNIEILGKLKVTGSITGNATAAEIYAESAQINGEIRSSGSVKIGQSSVILGNIFATSAVIAGAVKGDIDVCGPVILDTSAIVMGNIKSKSVQINNGAVIEGMCSQCYAEISPTAFFDDVKKNRKLE
ncbi:hypothetical protein IMSAGC011_00417 [Lachnospiraceae bacterium]|nr:hypothetical protein IMSAGC011_00417 [Lachnospiraceae bacterium]